MNSITPMPGTRPGPALAHPADDQLYDYGHGRLGEVESSLLDRHLAECPACARKLERGRRLLTVLGGLRPAAHGEAQHREWLRRAILEAARRAKDSYRQRLNQWAAQASAFAGLVLQWTPGASRVPAQLELVRSFISSSSWHLEAGPAPTKPLNTWEPHGSAWPAAADRIGIRVRHWPSSQPSPLLVFAPADQPGRPEVRTARRGAGGSDRVASFTARRAGRYLVGFETGSPTGDGP